MKKSNVIGLTIGIVVVIVAVSLICWFAIKPVPNFIQGEVEATSVKISSKVPGRIEQMDVKEGQQVTKGQQLFMLSTPEVQAKLQQAQAVRQAAGAQSEKARRGARVQEIEAAYNMWKKRKRAGNWHRRVMTGSKTCTSPEWCRPRNSTRHPRTCRR